MAALDSPSFCVLPWVSVCASVDGVWGRCCVDGSIYHDDLYASPEEPAFSLKPDALGCAPNSRFAADNPERVLGIDAAFNAPNMRRTRMQMLAGETVAACAYCHEREAAGGRSYRQDAPAMIADRVDIDAIVATTRPDGRIEGFPAFLDLRLGNACNLACVMCGYPVSSRWGLEAHPEWAPAHIDPYREDTEFWNTLSANATSLRRLYFAGGEPFLQAGHIRLVNMLIESGAASQVDVVYHSNLTVLPPGLVRRLLSEFRSVGIGASCDGTGEVFERIRVGARWDVFLRHLRSVRDDGADVWLAVAPQRDNVMYLRGLVELAEQEGIRVNLNNVVHWPARLSLAGLTGATADEARSSLAALAADCRLAGQHVVAGQVEMVRAFVGSAETSTPHRPVLPTAGGPT